MEFNDNKPIYLQIADQITGDLERGYKRDGDRLPSVREYAASVGVNANTVMRTYSWLQQEGIIYNQRGIGFFYSEGAGKRVREMMKKKFFSSELPALLERLSLFGITPDEFVKLYQEYLNNK
ncbi:MAG: GntR family transcriptional regulator [Candidatus Amulumruptor caecigallinarius]|nr:GntR family transcriptional regulator [Candidatus Amulumruptor caecigallinarius]